MVLTCISLTISDVSIFLYAYWPPVCLLGRKCLSRSSAHFLIGSFVFLFLFVAVVGIELYELLVCFGNCKYFLPICRLSFHFVYGLLCCAKAVKFN